ncbi:uncharacterized protein [Dermacentor albipictus]
MLSEPAAPWTRAKIGLESYSSQMTLQSDEHLLPSSYQQSYWNSSSGIQTESRADGQTYFCLLGCVCISLGLVLSAVAVLVMTGVSNAPETTVLDEGGSDGSSSSSVPSLPVPARATVEVIVQRTAPVHRTVGTPAESMVPTIATMTKVPTVTHVPSTKPKETTTSPRPSAPTTPKATLPEEYYEDIETTGGDYDPFTPSVKHSARPVPLLCTVSVKITGATTLPDDGLCDVIFYDSFYVKNEPHGWQDAGLDYLLDSGKRMMNTGIGVSFSPVNGKLFTDAFAPAFLPTIDKLLRRSVYSFGILNVHDKYTAAKDLDTCLQILQLIKQRVGRAENNEADFPPAYTVLGVYFDLPYRYQNMKQLRRFSVPSFFISITHPSYYNTNDPDCRILPNSMQKFPRSPSRSAIKYAITITEAVNHVKWTMRYKNYTEMAISFSMRGTVYLLGLSSALFTPCTNVFRHYDTAPNRLCNTKHASNYFYDSEMFADYTFYVDRPPKSTMMTFDSEVAIKSKLCWTAATFPNLPILAAAYDVDYDASDEGCPALHLGKGAYRRLRLLKALNNYVRHNFTDLQRCLAAQF